MSLDAAPLPIGRVSFDVLSAEEAVSMSVMQVTSAATYDKGKPKPGGLMDPRMGTTDRTLCCTTCGGCMKACPGHFGHFPLALPMYHCGFTPFVHRALRCLCVQCSSLLLTPEQLSTLPKADRWRGKRGNQVRNRALVQACKTASVCTQCGKVQPKLLKECGLIYVQKPSSKAGCVSESDVGCTIELNDDVVDLVSAEGERRQLNGNLQGGGGVVLSMQGRTAVLDGGGRFENVSKDIHEFGSKELFPASEALRVLRNATEDAAAALGVTRSVLMNMILTVLPIPPPAVRPSICLDGTSKGDDDLTHKLADIIKANFKLRDMDEDNPQWADCVMMMHIHLSTYFDNDIPGQPQAVQRSGKPTKSLFQRMKGKEGRVRGNLMGKRCDFSARTVITPDPSLGIDEVGVPKTVAMNLTYPETCTPTNRAWLQSLIDAGPDQHPGARHVQRDVDRFDLRYKRRERFLVEHGDVVERHLVDGDAVLFNRQPSLHKMSIMCHRVRVMGQSTFRLNLTVTTPYNADFDGDEMNLHVPQTPEARAEALMLMRVPLQIVSPQSNRPVMSVVMDSLLGAWRLSRRSTLLGHKQVSRMLHAVKEDRCAVLPRSAVVWPVERWTGKQLLSTVLPPLYLRRKCGKSSGEEEADSLMAREDTMMVISKGHLLSGVMDKGVLGSTSGGVVHICQNSFDPETTRRFLNNVQLVACAYMLEVGFSTGLSDALCNPETTSKIYSTIRDAEVRAGHLTAEADINRTLNTARNAAGSLVQRDVAVSNHLRCMYEAGSKGSLINTSQVMACVGQQNVDGMRIAATCAMDGRTMPHFARQETNPQSHGFVRASYVRGLNPIEFFFHAMGGREGLIDTAVKTSETGYIQRKLVKAMEDVRIAPDLSVRNSTGGVVQFMYGYDGVDAQYVENQPFEVHSLSMEAFRRRYALQPPPTDPQDKLSAEEEFADLLRRRECIQKRQILPPSGIVPNSDMTPIPMNILRVVQHALQERAKLEEVGNGPLTVHEVVARVESLLRQFRGTSVLHSTCFTADTQFLLETHIRATLCSQNVLHRFKLCRGAFVQVLRTLFAHMTRCVVTPGEMVGALAAQSIGEPATQMTLNTFHFAGISAKNVTLGIPRLKEIINVSKKPKTPTMSMRMKAGAVENPERALLYRCLRDVLQESSIWFQPDVVGESAGTMDRDMLAAYWEFPDDPARRPTDLSPWVYRLTVDRSRLVSWGGTLRELYQTVCAQWNRAPLHFALADDNAPDLVMHVRRVRDEGAADYTVFQALLDTPLSGVAGVSRVIMEGATTYAYDAAQGIVADHGEVVETEGSNLLGVLSLDCVDKTTVKTNDILEVCRVLGVEAARNMIIEELLTVVQFDGSYINVRHVELLVDVMVHRGYLMAITRHGINRQDTGVLMRCSFEETVDILLDAAAFRETDSLRGVTENIMTGRMADFGTGSLNIGTDIELINDATQTVTLRQPAAPVKEEDDEEDDMPEFETFGGDAQPAAQTTFCVPPLAQDAWEDPDTHETLTVTSPRYHEQLQNAAKRPKLS